MRRAFRLWGALLLAVPLFSQGYYETLHGKRLTFNFSATEIANLVWQLDTMAGLSAGDAVVYRRLWKDKLRWNEEDDKQLAAWAVLGRKHRKQDLEVRGKAKFPPNRPGAYGKSIIKSQNLMIAALQARNIEDYRQRLVPVTGFGDAARCARIVAHFAPRFQEWWKASGAKTLKEVMAELKRVVPEFGLLDLAQRLVAFTGAELPANHQVYFHLMAQPKQHSRGTAGTAVRNHTIIEFAEGERPSEQAGLLLHELTHHLYDRAPASRHTALIKEFQDAPEPGSMAFYGYLNEAIATAAGLLAESRLRPPVAFAAYAGNEEQISTNPAVAKLGKVTFGLVEKSMREGRTMFDGFAPHYIAAAEKALGDRRRSPLLQLSTRSIVYRDPAAGLAAETLKGVVHATTTLRGWDSLQKYPQLSGAVFLLPKDVQWVFRSGKVLPPKLRPLIQDAFARNRAFVYAAPRSEKATIYLFAGDDRTSLEQVTRAFLQNHEPFEGIRYAVPRSAAAK